MHLYVVPTPNTPPAAAVRTIRRMLAKWPDMDPASVAFHAAWIHGLNGPQTDALRALASAAEVPT